MLEREKRWKTQRGDTLVAAGTVVPENHVIPPRSLVMDIHGKVVREINSKDIERIQSSAKRI